MRNTAKDLATRLHFGELGRILEGGVQQEALNFEDGLAVSYKATHYTEVVA